MGTDLTRDARTSMRLRAPTRLAALVAACVSVALGAIEMRIPAPITTPRRLGTEIAEEIKRACVPTPCTALVPVDEIVPLKTRTVRAAVKRLAKAWNTSDLEQYLGESFFDRTRLLDTLRDVVPRDARLRVLAVRNVQTLAQYVQVADGERAATRVSTVRATVSTQVEFNDPRQGFVRSKRNGRQFLFIIADNGAK